MWRKEEGMEEENEETAYRNWAGNNRDGDEDGAGDRSAVGIGIEIGWRRHRRLF